MNTRMMFARAAAGAAIAACLVGCASSRNAEASKIVPCGGTAILRLGLMSACFSWQDKMYMVSRLIFGLVRTRCMADR